MNFPKPITGAAEHTAPHPIAAAGAPNRGNQFPGNHPLLANTGPNGGAETPANASTYHAKPDCQQCGRGYWGCICGCPEPDVMPVEDMMRIMPELFPTGWALAEQAAVRK